MKRRICKMCGTAIGANSRSQLCQAHGKQLYRSTHREDENARNRKWHVANPQKASEYNARNRQRKGYKEARKIYLKQSRHKMWARNYHNTQYRTNVLYKISKNMRNRLRKAIINPTQPMGKILKEVLGCSINKLKIHLQLKFHRNPRGKHEYMTWNNYGEWHIDHARPLTSFDLSDVEQVKVAGYYTNLQPLWALDNLKKGSKRP